MDFAVRRRREVRRRALRTRQTAPSSRSEDLEGIDLRERRDGRDPARSPASAARFVAQRREEAPAARRRPPREALRELGVVPTSTKDVKPVEVPLARSRAARDGAATRHAPRPGADAFRWFFYASSPPWSATRHSLSNVRALQKEFAVKLRNVYSFFTIYANIDGFDPTRGPRCRRRVPELDRWILSELAHDRARRHGADGRLRRLRGDAASRRVRRRALELVGPPQPRRASGRAGWDDDKRSAYETLYDVPGDAGEADGAVHAVRAPRRCTRTSSCGPARRARRESVHLEDWPEVDAARDRRGAVAQDPGGARARQHRPAGAHAGEAQGAAAAADGDDRCSTTSATPDRLERRRRHAARSSTCCERRLRHRRRPARVRQDACKPNFRTLGQRGLGKLAQELKKAWAAPGAPEMRGRPACARSRAGRCAATWRSSATTSR